MYPALRVYKIILADYLGLGTSYVLKSSVSYEGLWYSVAPVLILSNERDAEKVDLYMEKKWQGFDVSFLRMQADRVLLLDLLPFTRTFERHMEHFCSYNQKKKKTECTKRKLIASLRSTAEALNTTHRLPFRCMVSSLICWAMIFVGFIDVLDLVFAAMLIRYIVNWSLFQSLTFTERPLRELTATLDTRFFFGIVLHTSTPLMLFNSTLPYPVADVLGSSAFLHLLFALYAFRYRVLPAMLAERNQQNGGQRNGPARHGGHPSRGRMALVHQSWETYHAYQMHVKGLLMIDIDLRQKLLLVSRQMEQCANDLATHVVHVWSCFNDFKNMKEPLKGGPGFCYGRSFQTGAYILLG